MAVAYDMKAFSVSHFFPSRQRYRRRADERARGEGWKGGGGRINWGQSLLSKLAQVPIGHWATCRNVFMLNCKINSTNRGTFSNSVRKIILMVSMVQGV